MEPQDLEEIPLVTKEEAIAEVRRWLDVDEVDPEGIFSATGDQVLRYKDLIPHLEADTADGKVLRFAISRGRIMKSERSRALQHLLHIAPSPAPAAEGQPSDSTPQDDTKSSA